MDLLFGFFLIACILYDSSTADPECLDRNAKCAEYANYCDHTVYKNSLRSACALTCGYCTPEGNATSQSYDTDSSSAPSECLDRNANCANYANYCQDPLYKSSLRSACALTCEYCTPENNATPQPHDTECSDKSENCAALAIYCKDPHIGKGLMSACALTCGYCTPDNSGKTQTDGAECSDKSEDCAALASYCKNPHIESCLESACALTCGYCTPGNNRTTEANGAGDDVQCSHGKMTPRQRSVFLHNLNKYRFKFLKYMESEGGDKWIAASTKNMYKLSWDCELEKSAEAWVETCPDELNPHSGNSGNDYGESMFFVWSKHEDFGLTADQVMENSAAYWWDQPSQDGKTGFNWVRAADGSHIRQHHITDMMWGTTTRVGCSYSMQCNNKYYGKTGIVCCQYTPRGNYSDNPSREPGKSCRSAADCTAYNGSSCEISTGLCMHP